MSFYTGGQFIEREKAVARLEAITAVSNQHSARPALQNKNSGERQSGRKRKMKKEIS